MMFRAPVSLNTALQSQVVKVILPTNLRSNMYAHWPKEIRRRSMFSAGVIQADVLQTVNDQISDILGGKMTESEAQSKLLRLDSLLDNKELASNTRLKLVVETQTDMARGYGNYMQSQDEDVLAEFPAWELYRAEGRDQERDWPARWEAAGGKFYPGESDYSEGRMIALKDDPIWEKISRFDLPYAPFDYNSGMDTREIDRDEAEELGIIGPMQKVMPQPLKINDGFSMKPRADGPILEALEGYLQETGVGAVVNGVLKLVGAGGTVV